MEQKQQNNHHHHHNNNKNQNKHNLWKTACCHTCDKRCCASGNCFLRCRWSLSTLISDSSSTVLRVRRLSSNSSTRSFRGLWGLAGGTGAWKGHRHSGHARRGGERSLLKAMLSTAEWLPHGQATVTWQALHWPWDFSGVKFCADSARSLSDETVDWGPLHQYMCQKMAYAF